MIIGTVIITANIYGAVNMGAVLCSKPLLLELQPLILISVQWVVIHFVRKVFWGFFFGVGTRV
jgi:hypothetical protein